MDAAARLVNAGGVKILRIVLFGIKYFVAASMRNSRISSPHATSSSGLALIARLAIHASPRTAAERHLRGAPAKLLPKQGPYHAQR